MKQGVAYGLFILSLIITGANGIIATNVALSSAETVFMRTLIASIVMTLLYVFTGHKFTFWKNWRDFILIALSGLSMGVSWIFLYQAYFEIGVSLATLGFYCGPIIVMILAPLLFKEKITWVKVTGFIVVVVGFLLVNGIATLTGVGTFGLFCGAMSAVFYAALVIFTKKVRVMTGLENPLFQFVFSFVAVAVYVVCTEGIGFIGTISGHDWILLLILALVNTVLASTLYFTMIGKISAQTASILSYLELLSAVVCSIIFLGEQLTLVQTIGGFCIVGGAVFATVYQTKKEQKKSHV
ncbi:MAG TPA: DMT family transporter [Methanocorpusculum sp.]|nr:DMT family transporter [Methanocorpusculum sp.]